MTIEQDEKDLAKMDAEIDRLLREGYERGVRDAAAECREVSCDRALTRKEQGVASFLVARIEALLSPPATDGGAKADDYPDSRNAREHVAESERAASSEEQKGRRLGALTRAVPSERAAAQACAFCDAPLDLCSCGGMAP